MKKIAFGLSALFLSTSLAVADVAIVPFSTRGVPDDDSYLGKLVKELRAVLLERNEAGCFDEDLWLFRPQKIPVHLSSLGVVTFENERQRLIDHARANGGNTVFVRTLDACGVRFQNTPGVLGCASLNTPVSIEIKGVPRTDAVTILHEIGHSLGLASSNPNDDPRFVGTNAQGQPQEDRGHVAGQGRLMFARNSGGTTLIAHECGKFRTSNNLFDREPDQALLVAEVTGEGVTDVPQPVDELRELLEQEWIHGPPRFELGEAIAEQGLDTLRAIVVNRGESALWPNALIALGFFGEESDINIVEFVLSVPLDGSEIPQRIISDTKANAAFALGLLIGRHNSAEGAEVAFALTATEGAEPISRETIGSAIAPVDLSGLDDDEAAITEELILRQALIAQEIAATVLDDEALAQIDDASSILARDAGARRSQAADLELGEDFMLGLEGISTQIREGGFDTYLNQQ